MKTPQRSRRIPVLLLMLFTLVLLVSIPVRAQSTPDVPPIITADNLERFAPVQTIDFATLPAEISIDSGWFTLSPDGRYIAVVRRDGGLVLYDSHTGEVADTFTLTGENGEPATVLDARFSDLPEEQRIVSIHTDGSAFYVLLHTIGGETTRLDYPADAGIPVRVWLDAAAPYIWLEAQPLDRAALDVVRLNPADPSDVQIQPSAPEADTTAYVRIGRIPAPLAITATADGLVRLWDLPTGEVLHEVQLEVPPVFGRINETTGRQLAWRDPASNTLNLLDFETGENQVLANLGGDYIQALMLTAPGDVVLAVHIGDEPVVAAWDVATGTYREFGAYRQCGRAPDMVLLSMDGTTLVIGCDAGLEVWRSGEDDGE